MNTLARVLEFLNGLEGCGGLDGGLKNNKGWLWVSQEGVTSG